MKKYFFPSGLAILFSLLLFTGCESETETVIESSSSSSFTTNVYSYNVVWSSQIYMGAKIGEIHSDVTDLKIVSSEAPEGYNVYLVNLNEKDSEGLNVYNVLADMAEVTETGNSNIFDNIQIPITLKGSENNKGEKVTGSTTNSVGLQRAKCPEFTDDLLNKKWFLNYDDITNCSIWISYDAQGKVVKNFGSRIEYEFSQSPLNIFPGENGLMYTNTSSSIFGWLYNTDGHSLPSDFKQGLWETGANPEPAMIYATDYGMLCMAIEYDDAGNMKAVHRYYFGTVETLN